MNDAEHKATRAAALSTEATRRLWKGDIPDCLKEALEPTGITYQSLFALMDVLELTDAHGPHLHAYGALMLVAGYVLAQGDALGPWAKALD